MGVTTSSQGRNREAEELTEAEKALNRADVAEVKDERIKSIP